MLEQLLPIMQRKANHVAVVFNKNSEWSGIVTLEDVIEEVVGNNKEIGAASGNTANSNIRKITMDDPLIKTAQSIGINLGK
jgi:CBS domain containing-hemolysin-like protein